MKYNNAEIVHWMRHKDTHAIMPAHVDIDLTNICNQNCFYCNSADFRAAEPVQKKYNDYITLLDQLASWRSYKPNSYGTLHSISYPGGGEPTILPGYEKVIEHTIDSGFLASITTNGSKLEALIDKVSVNKLRQLAWVGIDIDAGNEETYELIRQSLTRTSLFNRVLTNAKNLVEIGVKVDFKVLLTEHNSTVSELESIFETSKKIGVRMVYFRPVIVNDQLFALTDELLNNIEVISKKYSVNYKVNKTKHLERNYKRCHQMFQFPVFCADGFVYLCCENRGN
jgi:MoaA/NifB/PqqE/SkfB family radical SAM enzyme